MDKTSLFNGVEVCSEISCYFGYTIMLTFITPYTCTPLRNITLQLNILEYYVFQDSCLTGCYHGCQDHMFKFRC